MRTNHKRLIDELVEGKKTAKELQILLHQPFGDHGPPPVSAEDLLRKILTTFTESLSVLTSDVGGVEDQQSGGCGEVYQIKPEPSHVDQSHCDDRSCEDSGESQKRQAFKDRRGCYKRRKTCQSWTVTSAAIEDGQAWRKYGQKEILNAPFPRAYFRCTRKYDQGCRATKQVQQIQDNPRTYQTTYIGQHTCKSTIKSTPMILGSDLLESQTVSSESGTLNQQNPNFFGGSVSIVKQEYKEGTPTPSDLTDNISSLGASNLWPDFKDDFALSDPAAITMGSENEDVVSNMYLEDISFEDFNEAEFPLDSL